MDRLTAKDNTGRIGLDCGQCEEPGYACTSCDNLRRAIDCLAAYEDTGLTPEEVQAIVDFQKSKAIPEEVTLFGKPLSHWKEIDDAEAEGRLIVLPVKEGTKVWRLLPRLNSAPEIKEMYFNLFSMQPEDFGKTIFLTREEAEAALEGKNEHLD